MRYVAVLAAVAAAATVSEASAQIATRWSHNGSTVLLSADGNRRAFRYDTPRSDLPVDPGDLVFEGVRSGRRYSGTAYLFSRACGTVGYGVSGTVDKNERRVILRGRAPVRDRTCRVTGYRADTLIFDYVAGAAAVRGGDDE